MISEIRFYLTVFLRRIPLFLFVFVPIASVGVAMSVILPPAYTARGVLLVEAPEIPPNMVRSTVSMNPREQLAVIQRRLLTRATMLEVARAHNVFEDMESMGPGAIIAQMRSATEFTLTRGAAQQLIVEFTARAPNIAAQVANDFVTRILEDNAQQRRGLAQETLAFFEQEVERLETELDIKNEEILAFQRANRDALPTTLNFAVSRQSSLQSRYAELSRDKMLLEQRKRGLEDALQTGDFSGRGGQPTQAERQLAQVRGQLTSALSVYTESSPRVQTLRARVEALESQVSGSRDAQRTLAEELDQVTPAQRRVETELEEIDSQLVFIERRQSQIEDELTRLARSIEETPVNALTLEALQRELETIRRQHAQAVNNLTTSAMGERIEVLSKGGRLTVLEQPTPPGGPSSPNRRMIAATGVAGGLAAGFGLLVLLELLNKSVRRPEELINGLGITPLVTVPYIQTPWERARKRIAIAVLLLVILMGIPAALYYVHTEMIPLDLLIDRLVERVLP